VKQSKPMGSSLQSADNYPQQPRQVGSFRIDNTMDKLAQFAVLTTRLNHQGAAFMLRPDSEISGFSITWVKVMVL
jgi:hypothetical protein